MTAPIRDFELERYLLGELPAADAERVRRAASEDPSVAARLEALEASNADILAAHPPAEVARLVEGRRRIEAAARATRRPRRGTLLLLAPAVAAAALVVLVTRHEAPPEDGRPPLVAQIPGVKGDASLFVHRQMGAVTEELQNGAVAQPGDVLQVGYNPAGQPYGVIVSIDGAGSVTLHFPEDPAGSTALGKGKTVLPHAYELDAAPAFERFVLLSSDHPIAVSTVLARARTLAAKPDRAEKAPFALGLAETSFVLRKQP